MDHILVEHSINISFGRRHADKTGALWLQRLKDSGTGKRLNLIYLANGTWTHAKIFASNSNAYNLSEVAQQSKARKKDDFLIAFSPVRNSRLLYH